MATYKIGNGKEGSIDLLAGGKASWDIETDVWRYSYEDISFLELYKKNRAALDPWNVPESVEEELLEKTGIGLDEIKDSNSRIELHFSRSRSLTSVTFSANKITFPFRGRRRLTLYLTAEEKEEFTDLLERTFLHHVEVTCECYVRRTYDLVLDDIGMEQIYDADSPVLKPLFIQTEKDFKKDGADGSDYAVYDNDSESQIIEWSE